MLTKKSCPYAEVVPPKHQHVFPRLRRAQNRILDEQDSEILALLTHHGNFASHVTAPPFPSNSPTHDTSTTPMLHIRHRDRRTDIGRCATSYAGSMSYRGSCSGCRQINEAYSAVCIGQKKLGHQERRLLLVAAPPDELPAPAFPLTKTASSQVAARRAIDRLRDVGLIEVSPAHERITDPVLLRRLGRQYLRPRGIRLTRFGKTLVAAYAQEIRSGRPIRWLVHGEQARDEALASCPICHRTAQTVPPY
jgi:hypothetical protein